MHVRFRLGGAVFPPTIFYKIYSHGGVTDVGAFAPRDYTAHFQPPPIKLHNHLSPAEARRAAGAATFTGWYARVENNGWRPVSDRAVHELGGGDAPFGPPLAGNVEGNEGVPWHFSKLKRREDATIKRKQRKRQWMQKMYALGKQEAEGGSSVAGGSAWRLLTDGNGGAGTGGASGTGSLDDEDDEAMVEEMLKWSDALDFESYHQSWLGLATTARPEYAGDAVGF